MIGELSDSDFQYNLILVGKLETLYVTCCTCLDFEFAVGGNVYLGLFCMLDLYNL